ncbi:CDP-glucose 4,6-dehydratase [Aerosakkonemataceae cyanobacterium BLCC-F50]|uniref:CDP-glucose 4,6-dehydratase n=1 Tax=Floridaenema flaviceps BLCC-F50 TaxID=3153642 RepID=A0ABV4Y242_9CYAN
MERNFWQKRRVLLTGHTGFKGSWLSLWLQFLGVELLGYALHPPTNPSLFEVARVAEGMTSAIGDITDYEHLRKAIADFRPEIIIHMAAQTVVHTSYLDPVSNYNTNVMGTVHLFEAIRHVGGVKAVVNVTSDKCYENREWVWGYRENDPLGGYDPYSSSKACAEIVTAAYRNSFFNVSNYAEHGTAIATARAGNVIGGGDWTANGLIADIVRSFLEQKKILIRNPYATRPWQHVLDALNGYLTLAEHLYNKGPAFAEAWNFGPNESDIKPVDWIVEKMLSLWGEGVTWEKDQTCQFHESNSLSLSCSKAHLKLGWTPKMSLEDALTQIITWTKGYQTGADMRAMTIDAISQYMNLS